MQSNDLIRNYLERLRQQKQKSLQYLVQISDLSQALRKKDKELQQVKKQNAILQNKLKWYNSVLYRSKSHHSYKDDNLDSRIRFSQSIIQQKLMSTTKKQNFNHITNLIQDVFVIKIQDQMQNTNLKFAYRLSQNNQILQGINALLTENINKIKNKKEDITQQNIFRGLIFNSSQTLQKGNKNEFQSELIKINPSSYYFGFCQLISKLNIQNKQNQLYLVGVITYLPFFAVFSEIINNISQCFAALTLKQVISQIYKLQQFKLIFGDENKFSFWKNTFEFNLAPQNIRSLLFLRCDYIFNNYSFELVLDIYLVLLLELPITLYSKNTALLSYCIIFFINLIQPLVYPYPIITQLPQTLNILQQSPFPIFVGCTDRKVIEYYKQQRVIFDLDTKVALSLPLILQNIGEIKKILLFQLVKLHQENKNHNKSDYSQLTKTLLNLKKDYLELDYFWKQFSETQIYQIYVHETTI